MFIRLTILHTCHQDVISASDSKLMLTIWDIFGSERGHTCDVMALDFYAMTYRDGRTLLHFTQHPSSESLGVNIFSQDFLP